MRSERPSGKAVAALTVLLALLIAAGAVYYNNVYKPDLEEAVQEDTSYSAGAGMPQKTGRRTLVAQSGNISVYTDGDYVIVANGENETEFSDWNQNFGSLETSVYLTDFGGDGRNDIVITDLEDEDEAAQRQFYGLYVLTAQNENNETFYDVNYTNSRAWEALFFDSVVCNLNQPQAYPNLLQYFMNYSEESVPLDSETGLVTGEQTAEYVYVPRNEDGSYKTLSSMKTAPAVIEFDSETATATVHIDVYAVYSDGEEQLIGSILSGIGISDGDFSIAARSVVFEAQSSIEAPDPQR